MKSQEPHRHSFTKLGYTRVLNTNGQRIILHRSCECTLKQAFAMGDKDEMRALFRKIKEIEGKHEKITDSSGAV